MAQESSPHKGTFTYYISEIVAACILAQNFFKAEEYFEELMKLVSACGEKTVEDEVVKAATIVVKARAHYTMNADSFARIGCSTIIHEIYDTLRSAEVMYERVRKRKRIVQVCAA